MLLLCPSLRIRCTWSWRSSPCWRRSHPWCSGKWCLTGGLTSGWHKCDCCVHIQHTIHETSSNQQGWALLPASVVGAPTAPVGTLKDGYIRKVPLPQAPRIQHASHVTKVTQDTCYLVQVPRIPTWSDLTGSLAGLGRKALLPFSLVLM
jgi:hypothetical protein